MIKEIACSNAIYRLNFPVQKDAKKINCWEVLKCRKENFCQIVTAKHFSNFWGGQNGGRFCAFIKNSLLNEICLTLLEKKKLCSHCNFFAQLIEEELNIQIENRMIEISTDNESNSMTIMFKVHIINDVIMKEFRGIYTRADVKIFIIDLKNVAFINSLGIGILLQFREFAISHNIQIRLINYNRNIFQILNCANMTKLFEILPESPQHS